MTTRIYTADEARALWGAEMFGGSRFEHRYPLSRTITTTLDGETVEVARISPTSPGTERAIIHLLAAAPDLAATVVAQAAEIERFRVAVRAWVSVIDGYDALKRDAGTEQCVTLAKLANDAEATLRALVEPR